MNYPRVNLLKKNEQRYQGAISRRFLLMVIVVTPVLLITLLSAIKLAQFTAVQSSLKANHAIWDTLSPRLKQYKKEQKALAANKRALELITGWKKTQVPTSELLTEIQTTIPASVQLARLSIQNQQEKMIYDKPADFTRNYRLTLQGVAYGERAEDVVLDLRKSLLATERMGMIFESITLGSMRKRAGKEGEVLREFSLTGTSKKEDK